MKHKKQTINQEIKVAELKRISDTHNGILKPEIVVKVAANPNNPLHDSFTWDNTIAGHNWRLWEARYLIISCVEIMPNTQIENRVFVSLRSDRASSGYRELKTVLSDEDLRQELLDNALKDFETFRIKYETLSELSSVFEEMRKVKSFHAKKARIQQPEIVSQSAKI